jgi:1-acyl-sn-glycerol-3-phosphate acyltransferase
LYRAEGNPTLMNRQPFQSPPQWWSPKMTPWLARLWRGNINRTLTHKQRITHIEVQGIEHPQKVLADGAGMLVTPNHSFHYDSYVMIETAHRVGRPFHFLTAWQVFAMSTWLERRVLQWHGCFSINREANDLQAFKKSIEILKTNPHPLIIFPEGDIYHCNDRLTPFRDGAAAIAISAAKKAERKIACVPVALKCFYVQSPKHELEQLMGRLEESIHWRPRTSLPLPERIYGFAGAILTLKELEYLGEPRSGYLAERVKHLSEAVLAQLEAKHAIKVSAGIIPERVKECRRALIKAMEAEDITPENHQMLARDLDDLFFVIQLFSYPGDYLAEAPGMERIAETLDKFEEDVLKADYPGIRGERHAVVRFGEPIEISSEREGRHAIAELTHTLEQRVQQLLDEINAQHVNSNGNRVVQHD